MSGCWSMQPSHAFACFCHSHVFLIVGKGGHLLWLCLDPNLGIAWNHCQVDRIRIWIPWDVGFRLDFFSPGIRIKKRTSRVCASRKAPWFWGLCMSNLSDKHQEMSIIEHVEPWLSTIFLSYDYMMLYDLLAIPLCHAAINDTTLLWTPQKVSAFAGRSCGCRAPSCLLNLWQLLGYPPTPLPCLRGRRKGRANQTVLAVPELGFR